MRSVVFFAGLLGLTGLVSPSHSADFDIIDAPEVIIQEAVHPDRFSTWTGGYVGLSAGFDWLNAKNKAMTPAARMSDNAPSFGIHGGYLQHVASYVAGLEASYNYQNFTNTNEAIRLKHIWSLKARLGYSYNNILLSAHAGANYAITNQNVKDWGAVFGAGVDYALTKNLAIGVQYDHEIYKNFGKTRNNIDVDRLNVRFTVNF